VSWTRHGSVLETAQPSENSNGAAIPTRRSSDAPWQAAGGTPVLKRRPAHEFTQDGRGTALLEKCPTRSARHAARGAQFPDGNTSPAPRHAAADTDRLDITLIVPTRNEAGNVDALIEALASSLNPSPYSWQLIFVDDSDDDTPELIAAASQARPEVSVIHRELPERKGGLASAVIIGYAAARGDALVVMDGDLQHPPEFARRLAAPILAGDADLVVASRYVTGASAQGLDSGRRRAVSMVCTKAVHLLAPASRAVKDPLSGFFALGRKALEGVELRPHGFKILLEVLTRAKPRRIMEVPFTMRERGEGSSKADIWEGIRFARHLGRIASPTHTTLKRLGLLVLLQIPLAAILGVQVWLSERLIYRNTAFRDEATYLSAGHYELYTWSHPGSANLHLPTYLSGAPTVYPLLAAWVNNVGGLTAVRSMSMVFMSIATVALYASAKILWGRPAGWVAAAVFVSTEGVQFLGSFATFDAMSLMFIAVGAWIVIWAASQPRVSSLIFLAAPVLVLANATKYASALYDPVVIALAFFAIAYFHGWRAAIRQASTLAACLILCLSVALALAPSAYLTGISNTTLQRSPSSTTVATVVRASWSWIGVIAVAAASALVVAVATWPIIRRDKLTRQRRGPLVGFLVVGAAAIWLAPMDQARIHTETSLFKHVTFGAWFGALAASWLISVVWNDRGRTRWWRYPAFGVLLLGIGLLLIPVGVAGTHQAEARDSQWSNSTDIINALRPMVAHIRSPVLMDGAEVAAYYLENQLKLPLWISSYYYSYTPPGSARHLIGAPAYSAAVDHGVFSVIALDFGSQITVDHAVAAAIHSSARYQWVGDFVSHDSFGRDTYVVWKRKLQPATPQQTLQSGAGGAAGIPAPRVIGQSGK
jgi:glycosyltransferase involved in cell wall biosynthesis